MYLHAVVRGRVQGVGFRWFVREAAHRLGLAGWVKNLPDGSVEVVADGDDASIESFRASLREGPAGASVTGLDELPPHPDAAPRPFAIQR
ncbi:MAG TPA: acylphosphatase [Gemmatimonadaceae bacterium]|jgi:acylphosphatase